eukprot:jgi/Chlat1/3688/Chrsp24S03853
MAEEDHDKLASTIQEVVGESDAMALAEAPPKPPSVLREKKKKLKPGANVFGACQRAIVLPGGAVTMDGCQKFDPESSEGQGAVRCIACGCHRNFHAYGAKRPKLEGHMHGALPAIPTRDGQAGQHQFYNPMPVSVSYPSNDVPRWAEMAGDPAHDSGLESKSCELEFHDVEIPAGWTAPTPRERRRIAMQVQARATFQYDRDTFERLKTSLAKNCHFCNVPMFASPDQLTEFNRHLTGKGGFIVCATEQCSAWNKGPDSTRPPTRKWFCKACVEAVVRLPFQKFLKQLGEGTYQQSPDGACWHCIHRKNCYCFNIKANRTHRAPTSRMS